MSLIHFISYKLSQFEFVLASFWIKLSNSDSNEFTYNCLEESGNSKSIKEKCVTNVSHLNLLHLFVFPLYVYRKIFPKALLLIL